MTQEIEKRIKDMIKDLAGIYYTHPEEKILLCYWADYLNECASGYDISSEDLSEFSYRRAMELYCMYLVEAGEIEDWDWDDNHNIVYLKQEED